MKIRCDSLKTTKMWQWSDKNRHTIVTGWYKNTPCNTAPGNIVFNMLNQLTGNTSTYILQNNLLLLKFCNTSLHYISTKSVYTVIHWENTFSLKLTKTKVWIEVSMMSWFLNEKKKNQLDLQKVLNSSKGLIIPYYLPFV